jgi:hypothetical protein
VRDGDKLDLEQKFQELDSAFNKAFVNSLLKIRNIWQVRSYFCWTSRRLKYKCFYSKSREELIAAKNADDSVKSLLTHPDIEIDYKAKTSSDEIHGEALFVNDIKFGSSIWDRNNIAASIGNVLSSRQIIFS